MLLTINLRVKQLNDDWDIILNVKYNQAIKHSSAFTNEKKNNKEYNYC